MQWSTERDVAKHFPKEQRTTKKEDPMLKLLSMANFDISHSKVTLDNVERAFAFVEHFIWIKKERVVYNSISQMFMSASTVKFGVSKA